MSVSRFSRKFVTTTALCAIVVSLASGCDLAKNQLVYDRAAELDKQDYRDAFAPALPPAEEPSDRPDFQPLVSTPAELRLPTPLVTVSVNQTVGLRDLLFELAEQADIDLELDPQIRGSVIFTAKERPFDEVVNRICEMAGLRYEFQGNVLRVELDRPYSQSYNVDYLNVARSGKSSVSTTVQMGGSGGSGAEGGAGSTSGGSESEVKNEYEGDLWKDLEASLEQLLTSSDTYVSLATLADPVTTPTNPVPPPMPVDANGQPIPPQPGSPAVSAMPPAVAPTLNIAAATPDPVIPNAPATFALSRQTGVLSVFASERQQRQVAKYLEEFRKRATTQILIEAKVLQVELNDEFATGINWGLFTKKGGGAVFDFAAPELAPTTSSGFGFTIGGQPDFSAVVQAISRFGTVRALSSPRVMVMNNQPAVVNMAEDNIYFSYEVETEQDSDTNENRVTIDPEQKSAPEGVLLNVVPTANANTGEITLIVRPTVSKIRSYVTDPTIAFSLASIGVDPSSVDVPANRVPELAIQEIDSILKLQSGQAAVLGGLMRDENAVSQEGLPVLGDIPFIGSAFRNHGDRVVKTELVIFLTARIITNSSIDDADRKMYSTFGVDRRPMRM
jgi:MSHA biogenesis protein MshL